MRRTLGALLAAVGSAMSALVTLVHGGIALLVTAFAAIVAGLFAFISSAIPKKRKEQSSYCIIRLFVRILFTG
jgi:hypothetical protein